MKYRGCEKVEPGIYFNLKRLSVESVEEEGYLPGTELDEYRRVPPLALLVFGPLLGGLYIIFLPVIGFALLLRLVAGKAADLVTGAAVVAIRALRPTWQPGRAFFSRSNAAKSAGKHKDGWVKDVEKVLERGDDGAG